VAENPIINYQYIPDGFTRVVIISNTNHVFAQEFDAVCDYKISGIRLRFETSGDAVSGASIQVSVQGVDGEGKPDGNVLWSASGNVSLAKYSSEYFWFDGTPYQLTFEQKYYIVITGVSGNNLYIKGYSYDSIPYGFRTSTDGGSTWSVKSPTNVIGVMTRGQLIAPVVETTTAEYQEYYAYDSIYWLSTLIQRVIGGTKILGICYSTENEEPTVDDDTDYHQASYSNGDYTSDNQLIFTPGVTYYVRAFCYLTAYPPETYPDATGYGEVIEVVIPSDIEVTTNAATQINYEWAMGNGEITSGTNATERGFEIKVSFVGSIYWELEYQFAGFEVEGELESMVWTTNDFGELGFWSVGTMIKTESEDGDFEEGEFSIILGHEKPGFPGEGEGYIWDRLFPCKTYEYRAYAVIDGETYYGEWVEFSTLCEGSGGEQQTGDDISDGNPTEPIIPIEEPYPPFEWEPPEEIPYPPWDIDIPELPPWVLPELPPWVLPDYPIPTFIGDLYYRKPYTKKDLDELRQKCIVYNKNSIEFALVLRHNMNVLREFLNMMTDYLGTDEFNDFTDLVPPQNLKELYLDPIEPEGFRTIINGFINNTVNNNIAVNRNFKLLTDGLSDYETSEDASFRDITSAMKRIDEDNPDVHRMKQIIDDLNYEVTANFGNVMYNLNVVRARLLS